MKPVEVGAPQSQAPFCAALELTYKYLSFPAPHPLFVSNVIQPLPERVTFLIITNLGLNPVVIV